MNTPLLNTPTKPKIIVYPLIAIAVIMIYWVVITSNLELKKVTLPALSIQVVQDVSVHNSSELVPVPRPVQTPPAVENQITATPAPPVVVQPVPAPVPQPVPTPPANH